MAHDKMRPYIFFWLERVVFGGIPVPSNLIFSVLAFANMSEDIVQGELCRTGVSSGLFEILFLFGLSFLMMRCHNVTVFSWFDA